MNAARSYIQSMTRRFILTGAPGAGKTTLLRRLQAAGCDAVEEAATDLIAAAQARGFDAPWEHAAFADEIAALQCVRETAPTHAPVRFSDRSLICTVAFAEFCGHAPSPALIAQAERVAASGWFQRQVFLVEQLSFIETTPIRRVTLEDAQRFGALHVAAYRRFGFELASVPAADPDARAGRVMIAVQSAV